MTDHDPLCPTDPDDRMPGAVYCLWCDVIAKVRADERAKRINPYDDYTIHQISDAVLADLRAKVEALRQDGVGMVSRRQVLALIDGGDA